MRVESLRDGYTALVVGASGGIGGAMADALDKDPRCSAVIRLSRSSRPGFDIADETTVETAFKEIAETRPALDMIFDATGILEVDGIPPEKALRYLDVQTMARAYAVNAIGPALLLKHGANLLARDGKSIFATLSARVGSIGDNRLGGWLSYRASKAALNQVVRVAAIEIARKRPDAVCVALHPGTIDTALTRAYAKGRTTHTSAEAAQNLLTVLDRLTPEETGGFFAYDGEAIPW